MKDVFEEFANKICPTCKAKCGRGICVVYGETTEVQCVDYEKDETKIKAPPEKLIVRANRKRPLMKDL